METTPRWTKFYDYVPAHLEYPELTLFEAFRKSAYRHKYEMAIDYFGKKIRYDALLRRVEHCYNVLENMQIQKGDVVCLCLPNIPDVVALFYAINKIGAVTLMVHPLCSGEEIATCMQQTGADTIFLLDIAYHKHQKVLQDIGVQNVVCCTLWEDAPIWMRPMIKRAALKRAKLRQIPKGPMYLGKMRKNCSFEQHKVVDTDARQDTAVILYSGGSSGFPKGIRLSSYAFGALVEQVFSQVKDLQPGDGMLTVLPLFHGFGLGVCMHTALCKGMTCLMMSQFDATTFANLIRRKKPAIIAGVPTLYEALRRQKTMRGADLSHIKGIFCGGDSLPRSLKEKFDEFLKQHGASVTLKEGYGLTETVTACVVTPPLQERAGSVGVPLPDVEVCICEPQTDTPVADGTVGEICIISPTMMLGYLRQEDTDQVLILHRDGRRWLHTGDLGYMDADGFLYFSGRRKRMFKVSGFPVYPNQIEECINRLPQVAMCCCVAIPDDYKMNKVKAIVVPQTADISPGMLAKKVTEHCRAHLNVYSCPRVIEVRKSLPLTKVGKVDFRQVEREQEKKPEN